MLVYPATNKKVFKGWEKGFFMDRSRIVAVLAVLVFLAGCTQVEKKPAAQELAFKSDKYGFSFNYPSGWRESNADLPDRWALLGKDNSTILLLVSKPRSSDLVTLGRSQAIRDLYDKEKMSSLKEEDIKKVFEIVKIENFNGIQWYSYGMKFSDKNIDSLVSGTICKGNEIMMVVVSTPKSFDMNREIYMGMLGSFKC